MSGADGVSLGVESRPHGYMPSVRCDLDHFCTITSEHFNENKNNRDAALTLLFSGGGRQIRRHGQAPLF
jgi:hypothetical protein